MEKITKIEKIKSKVYEILVKEGDSGLTDYITGIREIKHPYYLSTKRVKLGEQESGGYVVTFYYIVKENKNQDEDLDIRLISKELLIFSVCD